MIFRATVSRRVALSTFLADATMARASAQGAEGEVVLYSSNNVDAIKAALDAASDADITSAASPFAGAASRLN